MDGEEIFALCAISPVVLMVFIFTYKFLWSESGGGKEYSFEKSHATLTPCNVDSHERAEKTFQVVAKEKWLTKETDLMGRISLQLRYRNSPNFADFSDSGKGAELLSVVKGSVLPGTDGVKYLSTDKGFLPVTAPDHSRLLSLHKQDDRPEYGFSALRAAQKNHKLKVHFTELELDDLGLKKDDSLVFKLKECDIGKKVGIGMQLMFSSTRKYAMMFGMMFVALFFNFVHNTTGTALEEIGQADVSTMSLMSFGNVAFTPGHEALVGVQLTCHVIAFFVLMQSINYIATSNRYDQATWDEDCETASDFALLLRGLPENATDMDIVEYFKHPNFLAAIEGCGCPGPITLVQDVISKDPHGNYPTGLPAMETHSDGTVTSTLGMILYDVNDLIVTGRKVTTFRTRHGQVGSRMKFLEEHVSKGTVPANELPQVEAEIQKLGEHQDKLADDLAKLEMDFEEISLNHSSQEAKKCTGFGFAVFRNSAHAHAINDYFNPPLLVRLMRRLLFCCWTRDGPPQMDGRTIKAERAPEPQMIYWSNFNVTQSVRTCATLKAYGITMVLLSLSFVSIGTLQMVSQKMDAEADKEDPEGDEQTQQRNALFRRLISCLCGLLSSAAEEGLLASVNILCRAVRHRSQTDAVCVLMRSLYFVEMVNGVLVLVAWQHQDDWFTAGGLAETAFVMVCVNAIAQPILQVAGFRPWLWRKLRTMSRSAPPIAQCDLDSVWSLNDFEMAEEYSKVLKTITLGLWFSPLMPATALITMFALGNQYYSAKYVCLNVFRAPPAFTHKAQETARQLLRMTALGYIGMVYATYYRDAYTLCRNSPSSCSLSNDASHAIGICLFVYAIIFTMLPHKQMYLFSWYKNCDTPQDEQKKEINATFPTYDVRKRREAEKNQPMSWTYLIPTPENIKAGASFRSTGRGGNSSRNIDQGGAPPINARPLPGLNGVQKQVCPFARCKSVGFEEDDDQTPRVDQTCETSSLLGEGNHDAELQQAKIQLRQIEIEKERMKREMKEALYSSAGKEKINVDSIWEREIQKAAESVELTKARERAKREHLNAAQVQAAITEAHQAESNQVQTKTASELKLAQLRFERGCIEETAVKATQQAELEQAMKKAELARVRAEVASLEPSADAGHVHDSLAAVNIELEELKRAHAAELAEVKDKAQLDAANDEMARVKREAEKAQADMAAAHERELIQARASSELEAARLEMVALAKEKEAIVAAHRAALSQIAPGAVAALPPCNQTSAAVRPAAQAYPAPKPVVQNLVQPNPLVVQPQAVMQQHMMVQQQQPQQMIQQPKQHQPQHMVQQPMQQQPQQMVQQPMQPQYAVAMPLQQQQQQLAQQQQRAMMAQQQQQRMMVQQPHQQVMLQQPAMVPMAQPQAKKGWQPMAPRDGRDLPPPSFDGQ